MYYQRFKNKYGAKRKEFNGRLYMSKGEAGLAQELETLKKAKEIKDYRSQFKLPLDVNGYHICNYIVDFLVINNDDTEEIWEYKGFETDLWRIKWKLTEALYSKKYKMVVIK